MKQGRIACCYFSKLLLSFLTRHRAHLSYNHRVVGSLYE